MLACQGCGYALVDVNPDGACPECGGSVAASIAAAASPLGPPKEVRALGILLVVLGAALGLKFLLRLGAAVAIWVAAPPPGVIKMVWVLPAVAGLVVLVALAFAAGRPRGRRFPIRPGLFRGVIVALLLLQGWQLARSLFGLSVVWSSATPAFQFFGLSIVNHLGVLTVALLAALRLAAIATAAGARRPWGMASTLLALWALVALGGILFDLHFLRVFQTGAAGLSPWFVQLGWAVGMVGSVASLVAAICCLHLGRRLLRDASRRAVPAAPSFPVH